MESSTSEKDILIIPGKPFALAQCEIAAATNPKIIFLFLVVFDVKYNVLFIMLLCCDVESARYYIAKKLDSTKVYNYLINT